MQVKELDTRPAFNPSWAAVNVRTRSKQQEYTYSSEERAKARTVLDMMDSAYSYTRSYITYRQKFISVKLQNPALLDPVFASKLDKHFEEEGFTQINTNLGIIIRLPRK
jgi:hypothetical protein